MTIDTSIFKAYDVRGIYPTELNEELARRESPDSLVPIDRDPVPNKFSDLVRRYYEKLGSSE